MSGRFAFLGPVALVLGCGVSSAPSVARPVQPPAAAAPAPRPVAVAEPEPEGLEEEQIREVVEAKNGAVRGCHAIEHAGRGIASGTMTVDLEINPDGSVASAAIADSDFQSEPLHECVLDITRGLRFPEATGSTEISWRFKFRSQG